MAAQPKKVTSTPTSRRIGKVLASGTYPAGSPQAGKKIGPVGKVMGKLAAKASVSIANETAKTTRKSQADQAAKKQARSAAYPKGTGTSRLSEPPLTKAKDYTKALKKNGGNPLPPKGR